ncbi:MAG TPA: efflux transporter outer membrane subunit [Steroidobacteraceae bacterium]|nr:efflux transporter outer membrane subunit [Steroidobacteraceae bacterium]
MSAVKRSCLCTLAGAAAALLCACTLGPDFVRPQPETPAKWSDRATAPAVVPEDSAGSGSAPARALRVTDQAAELRSWWMGFDDPTLDGLIERAVRSNLDLRTAVLRIEEARAQRAVSASAFWPTVSADASYTREQFSLTTPTGSLLNSAASEHLPGGARISIPNPYNQFQVDGDLSWEIDLFGRVRRSVEASDAALQISIEDHRGVLLSVVADVAQSYMELRGAQTRLAVARQNLATTNELLDLTRQRLAAGLTTHIDVANALAQMQLTRAELPAFELQITQSINQLSELADRPPESLRSELQSVAPLPRVPASVSIGLPSELARRRPDIREAEANLHAATAQIGIAVADLFPRLTLTGQQGVQSEVTSDLFSWASRFGSIGPALTLPLFDRGRWKTVKLQNLRAQEAALGYRRTVLNALHEVENALAAYRADEERRAWLDATITHNRDALLLSRQRYESGVSTFIEVLDAERTLQQNELSLADSTTAVSTDLVRVYRALGGGWEREAPANPP